MSRLCSRNINTPAPFSFMLGAIFMLLLQSIYVSWPPTWKSTPVIDEQTTHENDANIKMAARVLPDDQTPQNSPKPEVRNTHTPLLSAIFEEYAYLQVQKLIANGEHVKSVFEDVHRSYPLPSEIFEPGNGQAIKGMVRPDLIFPKSRKCVVYGMGIADDSSFEAKMAQHCEVHAFDCSVEVESPAVSGKPFTFHQLCIGDKPVKSTTAYMNQAREYQYSSLAETMASLGHTELDVLKFDIEGAEWSLIEQHILSNGTRPAQLMFELHSFCANPRYLPPFLTEGRNKAAVNRLFSALFDIGYRVAHSEVNSGDPCCAEFVLVLNVTRVANV